MSKRSVLLMVGVALFVVGGLLVGQQPRRGRGRPGGGGTAVSPQASFPLARSKAESRLLAVIKEMTNDPSRRYLSVSLSDGRLMHQITEAVGAKRVVEVGTSTGYSGLWFTLALRSTGGTLTTYEVDPGRAQTAAANFKKAGVDDLVTIVVGDAHENVTKYQDSIDVLFLDADKQGYIDYLNKLMPLIRPGGVIFAHNMRRPTPDPSYIKAVTQDPNLDTSFVLMDGAGLGITLKKR